MILWLLVVALAFGIFVTWNIDTWFLIRFGFPYLYFTSRKETLTDVFRTHVYNSIVLPVDLDFLGHMNNARYLREAEFARCHFWAPYKIRYVLHALKGYMVMTASCCRYRRALNVFERFDIHTRILGWDDRVLYMEQLFMRPSSAFIVAVVRSQFRVTGTTPATLMERIARKTVRSRTWNVRCSVWRSVIKADIFTLDSSLLTSSFFASFLYRVPLFIPNVLFLIFTMQ